MARFTKEMKQRLKDQGWEFSHTDYSIFEDDVYSNNKYPGVYIMESKFGNFEIYSDVIYKTEKEKLQEAYDKGYNKAKIEFTPNPLEVKEKIYDTYVNGYYRGYNQRQFYIKREEEREIERREFMRLYEIGYKRGYKNGYKIAKMKYSFNFFLKTRKKIRQFLQNIRKQK